MIPLADRLFVLFRPAVTDERLYFRRDVGAERARRSALPGYSSTGLINRKPRDCELTAGCNNAQDRSVVAVSETTAR